MRLVAEQFDLVVLGGGSAARDAANMAMRDYDARVALVERERWGGSCPNVACSPTKAYLVAAELAHDVNTRASVLGIETGGATVDLARVRAWKESLKKSQEQWLRDLEGSGFTTLTGQATFTGPHTVRVGDRELESDRILVATGSRTAVPPVEGIEEIDWLDHVSALDLTEVPRSLLVVGGGAVGLEFGQAFSRFGAQVRIVDAAERIAPLADAEASATLAAAVQAEGIELATNVFVQRVRQDGDEVVATIAPRDQGQEPYERRAQSVLLASGRVPNVEELDLETAGVATTKTGITVDEHMRTSVPGIWAAGDVTAIAQFTPIAQYQARVAVADMFGKDTRTADYSVLPTAIFTDPELGSRRPDRGAGARAGPRRRRCAERARQAVPVRRRRARAVQDRLRPERPEGARRSRRLAQRRRDRAGPRARDAPRRDRRRPRDDAPRLPDLRRGHQGRCRARRAVDGRPGRLGFHGLRKQEGGRGRLPASFCRSRRAVLANGAAGNQAPGGGANWTGQLGEDGCRPNLTVTVRCWSPRYVSSRTSSPGCLSSITLRSWSSE